MRPFIWDNYWSGLAGLRTQTGDILKMLKQKISTLMLVSGTFQRLSKLPPLLYRQPYSLVQYGARPNANNLSSTNSTLIIYKVSQIWSFSSAEPVKPIHSWDPTIPDNSRKISTEKSSSLSTSWNPTLHKRNHPTAFELLAVDGLIQKGLITRIYQLLTLPLEPSQQRHKYMDKWDQVLPQPIVATDWHLIWDNAKRMVSCVWQKESIYKIITFWYYTPDRLHKLFQNQSPTCWRNCGAEALFHTSSVTVHKYNHFGQRWLITQAK